LATAVAPLVRPTAALAATTVKAALETAAAKVTTGIVSVQVANLTRSIMNAYFLTKLKMMAAAVLLAIGVLGVGYSAILATAPSRPGQNADATVQQGENKQEAKPGKEGAKQAAAQKEKEIQRPPIISEAGAESANNLKQILIALHNYHDVHGGF